MSIQSQADSTTATIEQRIRDRLAALRVEQDHFVAHANATMGGYNAAIAELEQLLVAIDPQED